MKRSVCAGISLLMTAALALPALAQSEAENNAYRIFYNEKDPKKKIEAGEKFLTDFKESTYRSPILQTILGAYVQAQNWAKVIEHGDKLQTELQTWYQRPLRLEIDVAEPASETPAERSRNQQRDRQERAIASIEQDPFVRDVVDLFDASIDESTIKPV